MSLKHIKWYLSYVIRHKYYVFLISASNGYFWMGLLHDLSKFMPDEFFAYANYFGPKWEDKTRSKYEEHPLITNSEDYDIAWLKHRARNEHHWQHWCSVGPCGTVVPKRMPPERVLEMVFDWWAAGKAQNNKQSTVEWFLEHEYEMVLHEDTKKMVYHLLELDYPRKES